MRRVKVTLGYGLLPLLADQSGKGGITILGNN